MWIESVLRVRVKKSKCGKDWIGQVVGGKISGDFSRSRTIYGLKL